MHQYSTSTYQTLSMRPDAVHSALNIMPRLGLEHPFLLDALFAFTSLHLAYLKPAEAQVRIVDASRYHSQALAYCRQQLPMLSAAECQAMFHCSAALGMMALAFRAVDTDIQADSRPTETAHQLAHLWRGTVYILRTSSDLLDADTYHTLFPPRNVSNTSREKLPSEVEGFLGILRRRASQEGQSQPTTPRCDQLLTAFSPGNVSTGEPDAGTEHFAAIDSLEEVFAVYNHEPNRILAWLVLVGPLFMDALAGQQPLACAITLLWSITFRKLECKWWTTGFRQQLVEELVPIVSGVDSELAELAAWVQSQG